jgi:hypothetical protein
MRRLVEGYVDEAHPWSWLDGIGRCRKEIEAALPGGNLRSPDDLSRQLGEMNWKITEIPLKQSPSLVPVPGWLPAFWTTSITCWLILVLIFASAANAGARRVRASLWSHLTRNVWTGPEDAGAETGIPGGNWSFGDPRRRQIDWDIPRPAVVPTVDVGKILPATPEQVAYALVEGERELLKYRRSTVKPLIAVRVSTSTGQGFIMFDGQDGSVAERRVYQVKHLPPERSWFELDRHLAVYLGVSAPEIETRQPEPVDVLQGVP